MFSSKYYRPVVGNEQPTKGHLQPMDPQLLCAPPRLSHQGNRALHLNTPPPSWHFQSTCPGAWEAHGGGGVEGNHGATIGTPVGRGLLWPTEVNGPPTIPGRPSPLQAQLALFTWPLLYLDSRFSPLLQVKQLPQVGSNTSPLPLPLLWSSQLNHPFTANSLPSSEDFWTWN